MITQYIMLMEKLWSYGCLCDRMTKMWNTAGSIYLN